MKPERYIHIAILLALTLAVSSLTGCADESANASAVAPPPPAVTVSAPTQKPVTAFADYTGTTQARESVTIRARVEGVLESMHFTPGAEVKKGDLLFTIDAKPYRARLDEAVADLAIRRAELKAAEATSLRRHNAYKDKAVSEVAVIEANANLETAMASVNAAVAAVDRAKLDLSYTRVTAPISGRIGRDLVNVGNLVGAGEQTALTTLVQDTEIYAYFTVSERDILRHSQFRARKAGLHIPVMLGLSSDKGYPYTGYIDYIDNSVDAATGTIRIRGVFPNEDGSLLPGLFAKIRVPLGSAKDSLLVPETALNRDQNGYFLLVADETNKVRYQPVVIGSRDAELRVVTQGVTASDKVIINGLQKARSGAMVTPMEAKPEGSANQG